LSTNYKSSWIWPAKGKILSSFNDNVLNHKGIDIAGKIGDPVLAGNSGTVVYSGCKIPGYGKLIIIKHNDAYLSAYAYNHSALVKEGQNVLAGQKIATIGYNNANSSRLHFEIRKNGKPIDPMIYLPHRR
jgi:lipoprotein NlpD